MKENKVQKQKQKMKKHIYLIEDCFLKEVIKDFYV